MKRKISDSLIKWKNSRYRKPLILWGARQVGKTWIMKEFGRTQFKSTVYISFYNNSKIARIFEEDYDVKRIINALEINLHVTIVPEETLVIFDEVQSAPKVVESLKYFCEDAPQFAVIAAGSLLGVALHEGISFPVGKVDELKMHPMSFAEFLEALGEKKLLSYLSDYKNPVINEFSDNYISLLKEYYCVGGMPEAVQHYVDSRNFDEVRAVQLSILNQYEGDFGKHVAPGELPRIKMVWASLPVQLAKENKKFFFGQIKKGARQKDFEIAIQWLLDSGLVHKVNRVSKPAVPLKSYTDISAFKLYMLDIGLMCAMSELDIESVITGNDLFTEFKGALTEQYVLQQLIAETEYTPYYYAGEKSTYETDFLIQKKKNILPIEVKAETNLKSKSLRAYCQKFKPAEALRTSMAGYKEQDWMKNIPLWAIQGL